MADNGNGLPTWNKFAAFEVFGDYRPNGSARLLVRVATPPDRLAALLSRRANDRGALDPDLGGAVLRAGLGLLRTELVSFAYATVEEAIVLLRPDALSAECPPIVAQNRLVAHYAAQLSVLVGEALGANAQIFEVPDLTVARRGLSALAEDVEEATPRRSAMWLGAQLQGRGEPFHPSMVETLEEQSHLLQTHGIDMDALPGWWWRGMAATRREGQGVAVLDELPTGDDFGALLEA